MKEMPTDDPLFGKGTIRADGRKIHPGYLFEVKKPSESKGPWDYYKLVAHHPGRGSLHAGGQEPLCALEEVVSLPPPGSPALPGGRSCKMFSTTGIARRWGSIRRR